MSTPPSPRPRLDLTRWARSGTACLALTLAAGALGAAPASGKGPGPGQREGQQSLTGALSVEASVVLDANMFDSRWGDLPDAAVASTLDLSGQWASERDLGSMYATTMATGAQAAWRAGITGAGVTVAVIDTGIAPVAGLDAPGKVVDGPDLSFDSQAPEGHHVDEFGHGTHLAGIIAGKDVGADTRRADGAHFMGVAPDARLLNMKVGAGDGGVDVSQVIAALDWVVQHRRDHGMNVRVISLAYGTASVQPWQEDPLARAVENAWRAGIVVVTAAGNDGLDAPSLLMPAVDPHVLAVGAVDHRNTAASIDDQVAAFTNGGSAARRPDVLAPGKSMVSLRVPGSYVDEMFPSGLVTGDTTGRFFRGSGTSQATAVVAGQVALLLQARPDLTPDEVKVLLGATATPLLLNPHPAMGSGVVNLGAALVAPVPSTRALAKLPVATGLGSLDASRGGEYAVSPITGEVLRGEVDALGGRWSPLSWTVGAALGSTWSGGTWNGRTWTGDGWDGDAWRTAPWTGASWTTLSWEDHVAASQDAWSARSWRGDGWEARSWRGDGWSARSWRQDSWLGRSWRSLLG